MHKNIIYILLIINCFLLTGCGYINRKEALNYDNISTFEYQGNTYYSCEDFNDYYIYGEKTMIGYTIGSHYMKVKTYVSNLDKEKNIIFQENRLIWIKEGYSFDNEEVDTIILEYYNYSNKLEGKKLSIESCIFSDFYEKVSIDKEKLEDTPVDIKVVFNDYIEYYMGEVYIYENNFYISREILDYEEIYVINSLYFNKIYEEIDNLDPKYV